MGFLTTIAFTLSLLLPFSAIARVELYDEPSDTHPVIKCNFTNEQAEPTLLTAIIDPEWSQVVTVSREGKLLPPATGLKLQIEMKETNPASYVWTMLKPDGRPYVHIQELATDPPRYSILGRKPGTYECYRQLSSNIEYYKRF